MGVKVRMDGYYHTAEWASSMMLQSANKLRLLAEREPKPEPFPFLVPSILMAFGAIETCTNESIDYKLKDQALEEKFLEYLRKNLLSMKIENKLLKLTRALTGRTFDTNKPLWEKFKKLQELRNKLMHYKLEKMTENEAEEMKKLHGSEHMEKFFYKDLFHKEVNLDKAREAFETAKQVMNELYFYYLGKREDGYKEIKT